LSYQHEEVPRATAFVHANHTLPGDNGLISGRSA